MDPDLVITVLFVCEVVLAALVFAFFVLHETHKGHAATASAPRVESAASCSTASESKCERSRWSARRCFGRSLPMRR